MEGFLIVETVPVLTSVQISPQYWVWLPSLTVAEWMVHCEPTALCYLLSALQVFIRLSECWVDLVVWIAESVLSRCPPVRCLNKIYSYIPVWMWPLKSAFTVLAGRTEFWVVNKDLFIEIEPGGGQSVHISSKFIGVERSFCHVGKTFCVNVLSFNAGNKASVAWNGHAFGFNGILSIRQELQNCEIWHMMICTYCP